MRLRSTAAVAATTVLGAGAAVAAGRYASDRALTLSPSRPLPGDPRLTVHATAAGRITLTRALASLRPGTYGLVGDRCHAVIGPVVDGVPHSPDTVVRRLERVTHGTLQAGARVRMTPQVHYGDPGLALGLDFSEVRIPGELGESPAWFLPGNRDTWAILVHGLGARREHPMVVLPLLHRGQFPVLDLAYRGDPGAPRTADALSQLGDAQWRDVEAAVRYAVRHGAQRVVLHGWSTGAAMALRVATESELRHRVSGLVLDSPVLDWQVTLRALAAARGVPAALLPLAVRAARGRTGLALVGDAGTGDLEFADRLSTPVLLAHGPDDFLAPWHFSRELAARRPELVTLRSVPRAPHAAMWNADPAGYDESLRRFLTPLV